MQRGWDVDTLDGPLAGGAPPNRMGLARPMGRPINPESPGRTSTLYTNSSTRVYAERPRKGPPCIETTPCLIRPNGRKRQFDLSNRSECDKLGGWCSR